MPVYTTPGVYLQPQPVRTPDIQLVRTDIAGFVGYAERGPLAPADSPSLPDPAALAIRLTSWNDYRSRFGGLTEYAYMPYAVRAFFENGGTTCYVVRVAASTASDPLSNPQTAYFALPMGDAATQVTTVVQFNGANLTVGSTHGLVPGTVIGVGPAGALQLATIVSVADGQNLTVANAFSRAIAIGAPVWLLIATTLSADALAGQIDLQVTDSSFFQAGDTVTITSEGKAEVTAIDSVIDANKVSLTGKLRGNYNSGSLLRKQTNGLRIEALSPGMWGNRLDINLTPVLPGVSSSVFDLQITLRPGPDLTQPPEAETFLNLSLSRSDSRFAETVVNDTVNGSNLIQLSIPLDFDSFSVVNGRISPFPVTLAGGRDGLSKVTARDFIGADGDFRGLRVLEEVDEVAILAAPDAVNTGQAPFTMPQQPEGDPCQPPLPEPASASVPDDPTAQPPTALPNFGGVDGLGAIYQAMIDQARRLLYRVAVFDTPDNRKPSIAAKWVAGLGLPEAFLQFGAVYYPWVSAPDGLTNEHSARRVPPSGHITGVYAQVDNSVGVQQPPANIELQFAVDVGKELTDSQVGSLNKRGINTIRSFPGRGIRIWGARSLAAAFPQQADWWFIHVRRTLSMIEDSIEKSMQWTVFEMNDDKLRRTLKHSLTVMLEKIWLTGGLQGTSAQQAFYVKCDSANNPQSQIDLGMLVCEVGVAIAAPMEFLIFQVRRLPDGTAVTEA